MVELYSIADAILEVAPQMAEDILRRLSWYRRNGNYHSGVQEFKELYDHVIGG